MTTHEKSILGIHHVTAITGDAQKNIDFYCGVLGLRLVKLTVNFDDPASYHLYYGDDSGRPGTILTFFAWPGAARGRIGPPQVSVTAFGVPAGSVGYWVERLKEKGVDVRKTAAERFGERVLSFSDRDGMQLEIVGEAVGVSEAVKGEPWTLSPIPAAHAIRGFHSVTIAEEGFEKTAALLAEVMGFTSVGSEQNRYRYRAGGAEGERGLASMVDLLCVPDARRGAMGAGAVHHVAFRTKDDAQQAAWHKEIAGKGFNVSPVMDRTYFHSIYYREPGGVLFEVATDNPGFTIDEPREQLGGRLMLPPWLEKHRAEIEQAVPPVRLPGPQR